MIKHFLSLCLLTLSPLLVVAQSESEYAPSDYVGKEWTLTSYLGEDEMESFHAYPYPTLWFSSSGKIRGHMGFFGDCYWDISYLVNEYGLTVYRDPQKYGDCEEADWMINLVRRCNDFELMEDELHLKSGGETLMIFEYLPE